MDIHMPEMDGLEATRHICERFPEPESRPRIIALSADTLQALRERWVCQMAVVVVVSTVWLARAVSGKLVTWSGKGVTQRYLGVPGCDVTSAHS